MYIQFFGIYMVNKSIIHCAQVDIFQVNFGNSFESVKLLVNRIDVAHVMQNWGIAVVV